jgi:hypothetical protein
MKLQMNASLSAIAAALMLVSCASKGPVSADARDGTSSEYLRLAENASKQVVCRRQAVTGSRIESQVCFTQAELKDQREQALQVMRNMQESAALRRSMADRPPSPPPSAPRNR